MNCIRATILMGAVCSLWPSILMADVSDEEFRRQVSRAPDDVEKLVRVAGDDLDAKWTISTAGVTDLEGSRLGDASFLRGFVNKATGDVSAQIYHNIIHYSRGWIFFQTATYQVGGELRETSAIRIASDAHCRGRVCAYEEHAGVPVPFADLEAIADEYESDKTPKLVLKYRIKGRSGDSVSYGFPMNEVVAFVRTARRLRDGTR